MAMAGLGRPSEIWLSPLHYFLTLRHEYLETLRSGDEEDEDEVESSVNIGTGVTIETLKQKREGTFSE